MKKLILGKGVNDAGYKVRKTERVGNKYIVTWRCPYYSRWEKMLKRCYSANYHKDNPTYQDCEVCDDWLIFSNFKMWMEQQDWEGKELDKDILLKGNREYNPSACVFVHRKLNSFLLEGGSNKELPLGVSWHEKDKRFRVRVRNPITGLAEHLGNFTNSSTAHITWCSRKIELIKALFIEGYCSNELVYKAMINRFEDMKKNIEGLVINSDCYEAILDKQRIK